MKKSTPFKAWHVRPFGLRTSLLAAVALVGALCLSCMCGALCGNTFRGEPEVQLLDQQGEGCCSSCMPKEEPVRKSCCSDEGDIACASPTLAGQIVAPLFVEAPTYILEQSVGSLDPIEPPLPSITSRCILHLTNKASSPPLYIQFEILLI